MPRASIPATGEAMSDRTPIFISRRRMLLGLAAASTAAATATTGGVAVAASENPKLIALAAELPAIAATFHTANDKYKAEYDEWNDRTPDAPVELTVPGTGNPHDTPGQPGETEVWALGGYLWRAGAEEFPRRIVVKSWQVSWQIDEARRRKRQAKKSGNLADFMAAGAEIKRLKALHSTARTYEDEFKAVKSRAEAWHSEARPVKEAYREALERHVAAIMNEPDHTMEGLIIKAQALAEWNRVGDRWADRLALKHGQDWQGQIVAAILRHARGGSA